VNDFNEIAPPGPASQLTAQQAVQGPPIPPQQRILLYSPGEWEDFVHEWAHYCLKSKYEVVQRFSGSGDLGIDVAGFADAAKLQGTWDNYQCKRFLDHAVYPTEAWPEIGKILWYSFRGEYRPPRKYYFVAPRGVGTKLAKLLASPSALKEAIIKAWTAHVQNAITTTQVVELSGAFRGYVESFDFSRFDSITALQIIEDHKKSPAHVARFGGGLPPRPASTKPPADLAAIESRYVRQLLDAYGDHKKTAIPDIAALKNWANLHTHFGRQREAFYHAESLRVFARDTVPAGTFESLQDEIHSGVIDTCEDEYADGYERVRRVTQAARNLSLTSNALLGCTNSKDRDGICHQLANEDRLTWTKAQTTNNNL
jgi:hypothetical protein